MTRRESAILSAFTGLLCGPFDAMHKYAEELLGQPIWTHQFASQAFADHLKELARPDFIALCKSVPEQEVADLEKAYAAREVGR